MTDTLELERRLTSWEPTQPNTRAMFKEYTSAMFRRLRVWRLAESLELGQQVQKDRIAELEAALASQRARIAVLEVALRLCEEWASRVPDEILDGEDLRDQFAADIASARAALKP